MKGTMQIQHRDVVQAGWSARPVAAAVVAQQIQQQRQTVETAAALPVRVWGQLL
jgi:hypothetical protein